MGKAAGAALLRELKDLQRQEEFPCEETDKLNAAVVFDFMPHARSKHTWAKKASWIGKFLSFAERICAQSGVHRTHDQCLQSNVMCRHFISHVASEGKGHTRPRAARMVLSAERQKRGWPSLSEDATISVILDGVEASQPYTKKQSAGITRVMVGLVVAGHGKSKSWWRRQTALLVSMGFVSLMRSDELCTIKRAGVRFVFKDGSEALAVEMKDLPLLSQLKGVLLHLPWRKNHKHLDCWIPVACAETLKLLLMHLSVLRKANSKSEYLFLSQRGLKRQRQYNHIRQNKLVEAMQWALRECIPGMDEAWAKHYTGHALRVGGSNEMRKKGIPKEVHRKMGGWMTLAAAQGYMALAAGEQLDLALRLRAAQPERRQSAFSKAAAIEALKLL